MGKTLSNFLIFFTFYGKIPTLRNDTKRIKAYFFLCILLIILFSIALIPPKNYLEFMGMVNFFIIQFVDDFYKEASQFQSKDALI